MKKIILLVLTLVCATASAQAQGYSPADLTRRLDERAYAWFAMFGPVVPPPPQM